MDTIEKAKKQIEDAWTLYREHFQQLVTTAAVVLLPIALLHFGLNLYFASPGGSGLLSIAAMLSAIFFQLFILLPLGLVAGFLAQAAQTCQLEAIASGSAIPEPKQAWKKLVPHLLPLVLTSGLLAVMATIGMFVFLIPGLWVMYRGAMIAQVTIHEGKYGFEAFRRSGELVQKVDRSFWLALFACVTAQMLGSSIVGTILPSVLSGLVSAVLGVLLAPMPLIVLWRNYREIAVDSSSSEKHELQAV